MEKPAGVSIGPDALRAIGSVPAAARIVRAWRELTSGRGGCGGAGRLGPGERTLVACSGGADSSALLLALGGAGGRKGLVVVGHVVHDVRPGEAAAADGEAVRGLAAGLGLECASAVVKVRATAGNMEANARRARYAALAELAREHGCRFVATGHQAEDQLETMLMAMLRGSGARGMGGIAVRRREGLGAGGGVEVIRPMLGDGLGRVGATTRREAEAICNAGAWVWRRDETNDDRTLLRNALRLEVTPALERLRPGAAVRAARSAAVVAGAAEVVRAAAGRVWRSGREADGCMAWDRASLRGCKAVVVGELLRVAARRAGKGMDGMSRSAVGGVLGAVYDGSTELRRFAVGPLVIEVSAHEVVIGPAGLRCGPCRSSPPNVRAAPSP